MRTAPTPLHDGAVAGFTVTGLDDDSAATAPLDAGFLLPPGVIGPRMPKTPVCARAVMPPAAAVPTAVRGADPLA